MEYNVKGLNKLSKELNNFQIRAGFTDANIIQRLMLVHSEISEAFEAFRKDKYADIKGFNDDKKVLDGRAFAKQRFEDNIKDTLEDEIAFCGENDIDIEFHIQEKMRYNELRGHKFGGKKF